MQPVSRHTLKAGFQIIASLLLVLFITLPSYGDELEEQYLKIKKQIKEQQKKIDETKKREKSIVSQLQWVNQSLELVQKNLMVQRRKIKRTRSRIIGVKGEIRRFKTRIDKQRAYLKRKLSSMQRYGNETTQTVAVIVSSDSFSQMIRNMHYLKKIAEYDYQQIESFKKNLLELNEKKQKLDALYTQLKTEEKELTVSENQLSAERKRKRDLLASVRKQKDGYQKMLRELTNSSNKIRRMLEEQRANTYKLTRFSLLKGKLPWPLTEGIIAIPYGSHRDPQFKTPVFRRGVYMKSRGSLSAKAIYTGKVVYADWFKGYGKVIIVNHGGGYHSVYANLDEIHLKTGDIVKRHQAIGKIGNSGTINAPALYFEIRYKGKPLNPLQWLAKKS